MHRSDTIVFQKEIRVDSRKLQIILEKAVSFVYPVLPAITTQHTSFVGFFNQCVSSFVSIFFSERFRVAGKSFTGGIRRISARVENTSRGHIFYWNFVDQSQSEIYCLLARD